MLYLDRVLKKKYDLCTIVLYMMEFIIKYKAGAFMKMKGSDIVIETLIEQGCDTVFGYPGGTVLDMYDSLYTKSDRIRHVLTAHEQGAAHAADGYFRATGKVGVCMATSGPGSTNLVTGIATAMLDSVPVVAITGNVATSMIGRDSFQEVDITGVTIPVTKHNYTIRNIADLADAIREAFQIAKSGRPGPVLVDVPKDIQNQFYEYEPQPVRPLFDNPKAEIADIAAAVDMIDAAERPFIYIGGGALGAGIADEIIPFAEKIDAYVGCSLMGLSAIDTEENRFLGMTGMHGHYAASLAQDQCDLMIAIGTRFSDRTTGNRNKFVRNSKIIHLDIDWAEIEKNINVDLAVVGDVRDAFRRIAKNVNKASHPAWQKQVKELIKEEKALAVAPEEAYPKELLGIINENITPDTVIATDVGQHQMWAAQEIIFHKQRKMVTSGGLGTMGYGLGAAIGAAMGSGEKTVLITGDGSFGMNLNEMATAVSQNADVTIVLFNNGVLGMVRQWQTLFYDKRYSNTTLDRRTDYVKLAEAFGMKAVRAESAAEFEKAFKEAAAQTGPVFIECRIDEDAFVLPMLPPGGAVEDMIAEKGK